MKFAIHGSCVTRDMFEFDGRDRDLVRYQSQCSLATKGTAPVTSELPELKTLSERFVGKMIVWDLLKHPFHLDDVDCLIVDLIDERFHVYRIGSSLITKTLRLRESGLCERLELEIPYPFDSAAHRDRFVAGCRAFKASLAGSRAIVAFHDARWATRYARDGELVAFEEAGKIEKANRRLAWLASVFRDLFDPDIVVVPDERFLIADDGHKWGRAPFHYVEGYYHDVWEKLSSGLRALDAERLCARYADPARPTDRAR